MVAISNGTAYVTKQLLFTTQQLIASYLSVSWTSCYWPRYVNLHRIVILMRWLKRWRNG